MAEKKSRFVVVTTAHQGVFAGYTSDNLGSKKTTCSLMQAQMCLFWSDEVRGVLGLASMGPTSNCRISKPVPVLELVDVTAIMDATDEARTAWEKTPWRN